MNIAVVAITKHGIVLAGKIVAALPGAQLFVPEKFRTEAESAVANTSPAVVHCYTSKVGDQIPALFAAFDAIVAIVSLGAVVRLIAPHLDNKTSDPAIVVIDEAGRFAIPVLSGHHGGANALAGQLAAALGAIPVLTTASDARATLAVDLLGREMGWTIEASHDEIVRCSAAMVNDAAVALVQEAGGRDWWSSHANGRSGALPANVTLFGRLEEVAVERYAAVLWISHRERPPALAGRLVAYRPPRVALGFGCDRGTPLDTLQQAVDAALNLARAGSADVAHMASIDLKIDEPGLRALAERHDWPMHFYSAAELAAVAVPHPSETVRKHTGTPSVAEAAALLAANVAATHLIVEKHKYRGPDGRSATISIARMPQ